MTDWKEEWLKKKYAIPPEKPMEKKHKIKKRKTKKSDHKHDYEWILTYNTPEEFIWPIAIKCPDNFYRWISAETKIYLYKKCKICGKIADARMAVDLDDNAYQAAKEEEEGIKEKIETFIKEQ